MSLFIPFNPWTKYKDPIATSGIRFFKSPRVFNILFNIEDYQGDGLAYLTIGFLYRSIQISIPFIGNNFKFRCRWRLIADRSNRK